MIMIIMISIIIIIIMIVIITVNYQNNCPASSGQTLPEQVFVNYVLGQYFAGLIW